MVAESTKIIESRMSDDQQIYLHRTLYIYQEYCCERNPVKPTLFRRKGEGGLCRKWSLYAPPLNAAPHHETHVQ